MAENKVRFLRGTAQEYNDAVKDEDAFYFTTDDGRLYIGDKEISGDGSITIDTALSDTSTNPVQNKVINAALNEKADQTTVDSLLSNKLDSSDFNNHANNTAVHVTVAEKAAWDGKAEMSDIPTTLPASGGNAETVGGKSAGEFVQYIGKITTSEIVDDPNYPIAYECSISPGTAQEIGLSGGWYHLKYFKHPDSGDIGWGAQIVLPLNNSTLKPMYRFARNTSEDWGTWHNFADGGNAASVGAYTEAKLAALEARVAALEGK